MVGFASLFLGLVLGVVDVRLVTGGDVARVVVKLDGAAAGEARGAPWTVAVDLGDELSPHELVAIGYGADGRELGTARQWLNRPRSPAEVSVVVARRGEKRIARLAWQSVTNTAPTAVALSVDGEPVPVGDPSEVELPDVDPNRLHLLRADLDFEGGVSALQDLAFGGGRTDEASARLTAIPVVLRKKAKLPGLERLAGWLESGGRPLAVVAVEEGPSDVVVVEAEGAREALGGIVQDLVVSMRTIGLGTRDAVRTFAPLKKDQHLLVVGTVADRRENSGVKYDLFPRSDDTTARDGGVLLALTQVVRGRQPVGKPRVSDAVAVGALAAAGRDRRRAVVLLLGPERSEDASLLDPGGVRRYLERLGVPLLVWCAGRNGDPSWGECRDVGSAGRLSSAVKDLTSLLERQRILWVEGTLLPHTVALTARADAQALSR